MVTYQSINDLKSMVENVKGSNIPKEVIDCNSAFNIVEHNKNNFFNQMADVIISKTKRTRLENKKKIQVTTKNGVIENLVNGRIYENNVRIGTPDTITKVERFKKVHKNADKLFYKDKTETDNSQGAILINGKQVGGFYGGNLIVNTNTRNHKAPKVTTVVLVNDDATAVSKKIFDANLRLGRIY